MFSKKNKGNDGFEIEDETVTSGQDSDVTGGAGRQTEEATDPDNLNGEEGQSGGFISMPKSKIALAKKLLRTIRESSEQVEHLLSGLMPEEELVRIGLSQVGDDLMEADALQQSGQEKVIEGVFDGEKMIGPDGKQYTVPSNYASKSKLVEGDLMKLTITANGTFLYKQIGPIERGRVVGELLKDVEGNYFVESNSKKWRVLTASVTYFRGEQGDEAVILVPKTGESKWAAIENIIKK